MGKEVTTPSGLKYVEIVEGTGSEPQKGQTVRFCIPASLMNGMVFDQQRQDGGSHMSLPSAAAA